MCRLWRCRLFGHRPVTVLTTLPGWQPYTYCARSGEPLWGSRWEARRLPGPRTDPWAPR